MTQKETEKHIKVLYIDSAMYYDQILREHDLIGADGGRARGILYPNGHIEIFIDRSYYKSGGILSDQLQALVVHETTELLSDLPDAHKLATFREYEYIFQRYGKQGLITYHSNLCNLMGGDNSIRTQTIERIFELAD